MTGIPSSERLQITIFGKTNSGKSSLFNALLSSDISIVSEVPGTTADPVRKAVEIPGAGPCVIVDTAGFDDLSSDLGRMRVGKTRKVVPETDVAVLLFTGPDDMEKEWYRFLKKCGVAVIPVISIPDMDADHAGEAIQGRTEALKAICSETPLVVNPLTGSGLDAVFRVIGEYSSANTSAGPVTGDLVKAGDTVLLVMPQDSEAPAGRLILPQSRTLRDLMDIGCTAVCCTADMAAASLKSLSSPPDMIITDSQVFPEVYAVKPEKSRITSFSILFAAYKGDIGLLMTGTGKLSGLKSDAHILIAEACAHVPLHEDIGRVKIPALLRRRLGDGIVIDTVSGKDFPDDLSGYDIVIHCGACMFGRKYVMRRLAQASLQGVPVTNYGLVLAWSAGILDKVEIPGYSRR